MPKLYVISGHGAGDNGACKNGFKEAERVRALAQKIKDFGGDNVMLHDFALNSYKSNTIGKGLIPKGYLILELHLDSSLSKTAKGGHIIIYKNFNADNYDNALAKMISEMFAGRSKTIVGRSDLANVNRAAKMGYNYRLMECCFISNADDIKKFNANMDELAKKILSCFGIEVKEAPKVEAPKETSKKSIDEIVKEVLAGKWGNGAARKAKLEAAGYKYSVIQAKVNASSGKTTAIPKVNYFPKYNGNSVLVNALKELGINSAFSYRAKIAVKNGIAKNTVLYLGTKSQNEKLLSLLKQGKLIKP